MVSAAKGETLGRGPHEATPAPGGLAGFAPLAMTAFARLTRWLASGTVRP